MNDLFIDPTVYDPVYDNEETRDNVIYIRRKMGFGTRARLQNELYKINLSFADIENMQRGNKEDVRFEMGAQLQELLLAIYNIVDWKGPRFMRPKTRQKRDEGGRIIKDQQGDPILEIVTDESGDPVMIPIECTRANIELLDPHDPFLAKVLTKIGNNNQPRTLAKPPAKNGSGEDEESEGGDPDYPLGLAAALGGTAASVT